LVIERMRAKAHELTAEILNLFSQGRVQGAQLAVFDFDVFDVLLLFRPTLGGCESVLLAIFLLFPAGIAFSIIVVYWITSSAFLSHFLGLCVSLVRCVTSAL
jgi:hypothetical protein